MARPLLRLSLRGRLYLVCAVLIVLLLAPSYYTLRQVATIRDIAVDLQGQYAQTLLNIGRAESALSDLHLELREYIDTGSDEGRQRADHSLATARRILNRIAEGEFATPSESSVAVLASLTSASGRIDSLVQVRRPREARVEYDESAALFTAAHVSLGELAQAIDGESQAAAARAHMISQRTARTAAAATGLTAGLAVLLALLSVGAITNPLRRLRTAMAAVAGGRFSPPPDLPYGRPDEIGDLTRSFRSMAERLAELDRLKAEFVSIASHELKTPVNVVQGYIEMMEDGRYGEVNDATSEALQYIREQTEVLRERVDQLLAMSRLEAQGLEVKLEPVALAELFQEIQRNFQGVAAQNRIVFRVQPDHSVPDIAMLDRRRVRDELLGNLLGNAFKFTPTGGSIYFRAWGEPGWVIFQIRDTGEGIPAAQLPYIFEKYYQAGQHAGKVGSGLGLAIAREIVEAHGGSISVESRQGAGSVFRVELPALAQSTAIDAPSHRVAATNGDANGAAKRRAASGQNGRRSVVPLPERN
ncbi:MAG: HAMP domain-containing histidine kinase [Gemmatimonadetes bacterium]|nr:HAMP domain-containing histidine kinase [Gemmatimonadota bacterium]